MQADKTPYKLIAAIAAVAAMAFFAGLFLSLVNRDAVEQPAVAGLLWPNPPLVAEFSLTNQQGKEFTRENLKGRWSFMFFGFTHCPDVCPTSLQTLTGVKKMLATNKTYADSGQIVFVSVDPDRDDSDTLSQYLAYFDDEIIGITGSNEQLKNLSKPLGILFGKIPTKNSYTMDHSAAILLIDPQGRLLGLFSLPHEPGKISESFEKISEFYARQAS